MIGRLLTGYANLEVGLLNCVHMVVRVGNSIQLANRCESGDAVARWSNCSDCFVVRSLDCSCPARGVKRRSWFFASRSTCSGASRQRDRPSITPIVCCSSGCLGWFRRRLRHWRWSAGNGDPLAPRRLPSLLALAIKASRWPAEDATRDPAAHSRYEHREPAMGRTADPWRTSQARHRCRANDGCQIHGKASDPHPRAGGRSSITMLTASPRWICSWFQLSRSDCSTAC
jgi:hypothetical protein